MGKGLVPPEKPIVLLPFLLTHHLNSILLWSFRYQFTCNLQWECLIFVIVITSTNSNQEPSITSPPVELHILLPNQKWFLWVRITEDKTFIFYKQLCLGNTVIFLSYFLFPIFHPCPKYTLDRRFPQRPHFNTKALKLQIKIDIIVSKYCIVSRCILVLHAFTFDLCPWYFWRNKQDASLFGRLATQVRPFPVLDLFHLAPAPLGWTYPTKLGCNVARHKS